MTHHPSALDFTRRSSLSRAASSLLFLLGAGLLGCANQTPPAAAPSEAAPGETPAAAAPTAAAPAESAEAPAGSAAAAEPAAPSGPIDWASMDKKARGKYMKEVVMPKMKDLFVAFDAPKYGDMKCATCHGQGVENGTFDMPNPELPPLPGDMAKFKAWTGKHPKMAEFMGKQVKPEMAKLLGMPEYDPATSQGFGCTACHSLQK